MEHISFRPQIVSLLRRLHAGRCLLAVTLPDDARIYSSALLEVDPERGFLVIDELSPEIGHGALLEKRRCRVRAELKGVTVAFAAELVEAGSRDGIAYYHIAFPSALNYGQRRAHYRPRVALSKKTAVALQLPDGRSANGTLQDISLGGLRIKLDAVIDPLPLDTALKCQLQIAGAAEIACTIELRFMGNGPPPQIGGRFQSLLPPQRQVLQKFIRELEREELKKSPRDPSGG